MDVTLPNGVTISGIPEGTNKWKIAEIAISKGLARPEDFGQESADPTEGMSGFDKFRAGWGKSVYDLGRGAGQLLGLVDRGDVQASRERDAPLLGTTAGRMGYLGGAVANSLPAAAIPGANTVAGATAVGAGMGLLQPSVGTGETLANVGLGGALGGGGVLAVRGAGALYRGGKALIEPFTRGGQERIAARALQSFAGSSDDAARAAQSIDDAMRQPILPGVKPTTAEVANNPGLAQLERTIRNNPEYVTPMTDRAMANKDAMLAALDDIAGDSAQLDLAKRSRSAVTKDLYDSVARVTVKPDKSLLTLMERPSMERAWSVAKKLAAENGDVLPETRDIMIREGFSPESIGVSGKTLHYLKMAMDDITDLPPQVSGLGKHEAAAMARTRSSLGSWMDENVPQYGLARNWFARMSRPVNQMEVGQEFRNKLQPALADFGSTSRTRGEMFARALREGDETAARVLGRESASLDEVLNPLQSSRLKLVAEQLARRTNADELGRAVGSNTGQNLVSQNVLRQILGPLGLPESTMQRAAESALLQSVMRPVQFAGQIGEQRVMQNLAKAVLDPKVSAELLRLGIDPKKVGLLLRNQQIVAPALVSGTNAARE